MKFLEGRTINHVYHLADLHIRNLKRHKEYRKVLTQFLKNVKKDKLNDAIIYLGGDIAHAKTEMSPELVREISWFLNECSKLHPTFVITGNHDCNMNNPSRLDVLTPIIENLDNNNVHYLRDTGVYEIGNLTVGVYSILSHKDEWSKGTEIEGDHKICFFHGPVDKSSTDVGYYISSNSFKVDMFDGYHIAMLGDIHRRQIVQEYDESSSKPIVVYSSSVLQQNHGELIQGHGYLLWDIPTRTFKEFDLHNDYGYITIDIVDGQIPHWVYDELDTLPKYPKIRARFSQTDSVSTKKVILELKTLFSVSEITMTRTDTLSSMKRNLGLDDNIIGNVKNVEFQNELLRDYLNRQFLLADEDIDKVIQINNNVNDTITDKDTAGNIVWIPKKFEFSNMFSYGENNVIDFTKTKGIIGIFAPNASGKSSLWDSLSFCIFDKSSRAFKAKNILNNRKKQFRCKFHFEVDGIDYYIERVAKLNKKEDAVKVDVNFWKEKDNVVESLNGEQRRETNSMIEQYLGTYEDFVLTTLSLQGNNALFIDKSQSERKDILSQFIGVDVFDKLYNAAYELNRENSILIKRFKQDDFSDKMLKLVSELGDVKSKYSTIEDELNLLKVEKEQLNSQIVEEVKKLIKLGDDVVDISKLKNNKDALEKSLLTINNDITTIEGEVDKLLNLKSNLKQILESDTYINIEDRYNTFISNKNLLKDANHNIEKSQLKIKSLNESLNHLNDHEYNPDCSICLKNSDTIIKNKSTIETQLKSIYADLLEYNTKHTYLSNLIEADKDTDVLWNQYKDVLNKKSKVDTRLFDIKEKESKLNNSKFNNQTELKKIEDYIEKYYINETSFELNKVINNTVHEIKSKLSKTESLIKIKETELLNINGRKTTTENSITELKLKINEVKELEEKYKLYEYYLDSVKRDGISYELISRIIPVIEGEINNILGQMVEFGIQLEMDGKNINAYIVYEDQRWPLEMSSGMERFISGLAIRVALINICNLPRPNFLVVDEGFGSLDSENMTSIFMMFNYLKSQFDFVMIISHIDSMRDIVDQLVEIKKVKGFSHLKF